VPLLCARRAPRIRRVTDTWSRHHRDLTDRPKQVQSHFLAPRGRAARTVAEFRPRLSGHAYDHKRDALPGSDALLIGRIVRTGTEIFVTWDSTHAGDQRRADKYDDARAQNDDRQDIQRDEASP